MEDSNISGSVFGSISRDQLRREKIYARNRLSQDERAILSAQAASRILSSPEFRQAGTILLYRAVRGEVRLETLETAPEANGKRLAYPLCSTANEMAALIPRGEHAWVKGRYGIAEPLREASELIRPEEIDLVICPCTVFDECCNRMGMGSGYYDRYLEQCVNAHIISVAFECQKTGMIPIEPWDKPMEAVFTEKAIYRRTR